MRDVDYTLNRNGGREKIARATYSPKSFRASSAKNGQTVSAPFKAVLVMSAVIGLIYVIVTYVDTEAVEPVSMPDNATVWQYLGGAENTAPLKVITDRELVTTHNVVIVSDWETAKPVIAMFVAGGREAQTMRPTGTYRVSIAKGSQWYGLEHLFGKKTVHVVGEKPISLYRTGPYQTMGAVINLNTNIDGNYPMKPAELVAK